MSPSQPPWVWPNSTVVRVIDGDSIVCRLIRDIGFNGELTFVQKLRLNRINATPITTPQGKAAATYLTNLVLPPLLLNIVTTKAYKYGNEWMAEITLPDGTNVSDLMVSSGNALYWNGEGPRPGGLHDA